MESPCGVARKVQKPFHLKALFGSFGLAFLFLRHGLHTQARRYGAGHRKKSGSSGGAGSKEERPSSSCCHMVPLLPDFFFLKIQERSVGQLILFFFIYKHHLGVNTPHLWARHNGQTLTAALLPRQTLWFCIMRNGWTERPSAFLHRLGACSRCRFSAPPTC